MKKLSLIIMAAAVAIVTLTATESLPQRRSDSFEADAAFLNDGLAYRRLRQTLTYPATAARSREQGEVVVSFMVDREGKVTDVKVAKSSHVFSLDAEAVRAVSRIGPFKPTLRNGTDSVSTALMIPILFSLTPHGFGDTSLPMMEFPDADVTINLNEVEVTPRRF